MAAETLRVACNDALGAFAAGRGKMEIRGATNRGNYHEDNGLSRRDGPARRTGKINQAAAPPVGFRCDGSRVHDLWTPRHFRLKIHYILHLAGRGDAPESYEGRRVPR